jgi:membrane associated rhomboid family serine protease
MVSVPGWLPVHQLLLAVAAAGSAAVALRLSGGAVGSRLRRRFVLGVPWGTFLSGAFVLAVYLFVQGGWSHPFSPTTIPYRAWSYFYPLGMLASGFAHAGMGHLVGNLVGTLAFGALAEYAWSHYPTERGVQTFTSPLTDPFVRIGAFVAGTLAVGVVTGLFVLGPAIGFSGVVFAFAGFALVRYPLATVVALVGARLLSLVYNALRYPTLTRGGETAFVTPWWADIAIQGHALGLFVGATLAAVLAERRGVRPSALALWLGTLLFSVSQGLWAVYVPLDGGRYRLYRAVGTALVFVLAALFASAATTSRRPLVERIDLSYREAALGLVAATALALALVAVPFNLFVVDDPGAGVTENNSVEVRDYTVFYAHDVPNQYVSSVDVGPLGDASRVNASGVIVVSESRQIWWEVVSTNRLAHDGRRRVGVGGLGWREAVVANYTGWKPVGNRSAYAVSLRRADAAPADRRLAYASPPRRAEPTVEGRNVSVVPGESFALRVTRDGRRAGTAPLPGENRTTAAGGITFVRDGAAVYATTENGTRVRVASRDRPGE